MLNEKSEGGVLSLNEEKYNELVLKFIKIIDKLFLTKVIIVVNLNFFNFNF